LINFHALQRPKTPAAPIHETMLNQRNIAMNTSVIEAIERQKTTNLYDGARNG
jgi:hypothetical protein